MNAKSKKHTKPQPVPLKKEQQFRIGNIKWLLIGAIVIITFFCYRYSLHNEFTHWDDNIYVADNNYIKDLTPHNLKMIMTTDIMGIYFHPLTMLSLAMNYHFSKMNPEPYYLTNIIIHVFNTVLIFLLVTQLLQAMSVKGYGNIKGMVWLAALCSLWHGIHPMHVESVSWLAERKDVLYMFFYLLGLMMYVRYAIEGTLKLLLYTTLFYFLSLISKPMAVTFPLSIFAIDILLKRDKGTTEIVSMLRPFFVITKAIVSPFRKIIPKLTEVKGNTIAKLISEKAPLFIVSVIAGIATYKIADKGGSITVLHISTLGQRMLFASHNFVMYFVKAFVPVHLSSFYPYPPTNPNGALPIIFYIAPILAILLPAIPLVIAYKAGENYFRVVLFGFLFYFFNVIFILQIVAAGPALMAERYSYVAYFSVVFMAVYFLYILIEKFPTWRIAVISIVACISVVFGYICYDRTKVWHDSRTLWENAIAAYPRQVAAEYENVANYFADNNNFDSAFYYSKIAVDMHSPDAAAYTDIANIYGMRKEYDKSIEAYSQALKIDSLDYNTYLNRAITYSSMGKFDLALKDDQRAYLLDSSSAKVFENRGANYLNYKQYDKAIVDYNKLIKMNPNVPLYYFNRGIAQFDKGNIKAALEDFNRTIALDPTNAGCLYDMSLAYQQVKDYPNALECAQKAKQNGYPVTDAYISSLQKDKN